MVYLTYGLAQILAVSLMIHFCSQEGAILGVKFFLNMKWNVLGNLEVSALYCYTKLTSLNWLMSLSPIIEEVRGNKQVHDQSGLALKIFIFIFCQFTGYEIIDLYDYLLNFFLVIKTFCVVQIHKNSRDFCRWVARVKGVYQNLCLVISLNFLYALPTNIQYN